jgi:hypothetical protein
VASVRRYAEQERLRVDREIAAARPLSGQVNTAHLDRAMDVYCAEMIAAAGKSLDALQMNAGFVAEGAGAWSVRFSPGQRPKVLRGLQGDEDETLLLPAGELWAIVAGPANWEDVWYGYRLRVTKREGAGYYRAFWEMLLNFDDVPTSERLAARFAEPAPP